MPPHAAGNRRSVVVSVNGYEYRNTVGVVGGRHMISVSAAVRSATGLKGGDRLRVTLTVADTAREVNVPADFTAARHLAGRLTILRRGTLACWGPHGRFETVGASQAALDAWHYG